MMSIAPPNKESQRLATLRRYHILDTGNESAFDDITRLAAMICKTPLAMISFIDADRQWVKSAIGIAAREISLDASLCLHAVAKGKPLVVSDLAQDPRFSGSPMVTGPPHLRFYASARLMSGDGYALGALCVADYTPRELTDEQREALLTLARQVMSQLDLRRSLDAIEQALAESERTDALRLSEQRFRLATRATHDAIRDWDLQSDAVWWNEAVSTLFGYAPEEVEPTARWWYERIHPQDRSRIVEGVQAVIEGGGDYWANEYRYLRRDGSASPVFDRGYVLRDANGQPLRMVGAMLDLSASRQAQEKMAAEKALFDAVLEQMPSGVVVAAAPDGKELLVNRQFGAILGKPGEPAQGVADYSRYEIYGADGHRYAAEEMPLARALRGETVEKEELNYIRPDGKLRALRVRASPVRDSDGDIKAAVAIVDNITAELENARAMELNRSRMDLVVDAIELGVWYCDLPFDQLHWNTHLKEHFGLPADYQVTIDTFYERLHPEVRERTRAAIDRSIGEHSNYDVEYRTIGLDNVERWVRAIGRAFYSADGKPLRFDGVTVDITDRKLAEQSLRESTERFRFLAESMPQKIFTARPNGEVDYFNRQWSDFTGLPFEAIRDCGWTGFIHPDDLEGNLKTWREAVATGSPFEFEHRFRRADGAYRWHLSRANPMRDAAGNIIMWVGSNTEMHDIKQAQEALVEADLRKDHFLATLAHELRNPLAPLMNGLQLWSMLEGKPEKIAPLRGMMERQVQQLVRLIDDLLDVSRISRGKIQLRKQRTDLAALINGAVEAIRPFVDSCRHTLKVTLPDEPLPVEADMARLVQVFGNLLHNAAKYTPHGGVIEISALRSNDDLLVSVSDNGDGIPPAMLGTIFDMFTQVDQTLERAKGGLGIGLTLVRNLTEMHGGSVVAESAGRGHGAKFIVRLPAANDAAAVPAMPGNRQGVQAEAQRILIVDDAEASANTLSMMLAALGHEVRAEYNGPAAIDAVRACQPAVVFLDIAMPGMNGYKVAEHLHREHGPQRPVLVALTGFGQEEDKRRALAAGFDHHLVKPASLDAIVALLAALPSKTPGHGPASGKM